ncbi:DNA-binding protein [Streptomyces griseorubiginosus]|uniref:DNA-binding protein n=1 Tax=Streptomyces griseorubiginosus TaxID=67304 RepID=UPI0033B9392D
MSGGSGVSYEELLAAGAVLALGTEGAGERAVPLTARSYTHPGLDDRVVVRLIAGELGAAEDLAAGFLGLEPAAEPVEIGLGARQALGFPEWVLVHHPEDGRHALGVVPELERIARQAKTKPKAALDAYRETARELAVAVPHFLPTFYEQAGRVFLSVENPTYAAQMFGRAREAEAQYGLPVDEERLDAVFLEFALAGALTATALSGYAKELAARVPASEALDRFTRLCVRRTAGGLVPSAQLAHDVRRLARAAGRDGGEAEQAYLADLLQLSATAKAAPGWWKSHRAAVVALARREPAVRGALLNLMPDSGDHAVLLMWLDILEESGALVGLWDETLADQERPQDGTAGWFVRFLRFQEHAQSYDEPTQLPALYRITELSADRLRAELAESGGELQAGHDLDLLDLLLSLDVPAAVFHRLELQRWAKGEDRRDLLALAAAGERFRNAFREAADTFGGDEDDLDTIRVLARTAGGRPMLADWVREVARGSTATGLPGLPEALRRLGWLPGEALRLAEDEIREVAATDLAPLVARTLRAGIIDELGWPAWEEAAGDLVRRQNVEDLYVADAWPYLITAGSAQVRVIGPEGTVLTHDLRLPDHGTFGEPGFHFVDGELLVHWRTHDHGMRGYWHHNPDRVVSLEGARTTRGVLMDWYREENGVPTLPLPDGGRLTGGGVLHRGDTSVPLEGKLLGDGTSYWTWGGDGWFEYDPATGRLGRNSAPAFLADAYGKGTSAPGSLAPYPFDEVTPAGVPVNGLLGWRAVLRPDRAWHGEDLAGRRVTVPEEVGQPYAAVRFPGADRLMAAVRDGWRVQLVDADGTVTASARVDGPPGDFAEGTPILPPLRYWHCLRPRDPLGSAALRRISDETARVLLRAGEQEAAVRELLPEVTDPALLAGIAGLLRYAGEQQKVLDAAATRLTAELAGAQEDEGPAGPSDRLLRGALSGLDGARGGWHHYTADRDEVFRRLRILKRAVRAGEDATGANGPGGSGSAPRESDGSVPASSAASDGSVPASPAAPDGAARAPRAATAAPPPRLHVDGPDLPGSYLSRAPMPDLFTATAFRIASPTTPPEHREVLVALLREFDALGLTSTAGPARWRRVSLHLDASHLRTPDGEWREGSLKGVLPLDGGAFLAVTACTSRGEQTGCDFEALHHDPSGRFEVPAPYTLESSTPVGEDREADWVTAFLADLDERGPAPWIPAVAEEFARLTGVTPTMARLVVAGLPQVDSNDRSFLTAEARAVLRVKATEAALAKDELRKTDAEDLRAVVAALLPGDPARLWTDGPDAAAAAEVWNSRVGRRRPLPEALLAEAQRALRADPSALAGLLDPASEPGLSQDLEWAVTGDRVGPVDEDAVGFTAATLIDTVALAAWLAHRLPVGDPLRAALPVALGAVRDRLAHPGLLLDLGRYVNLPDFRRTVGRPTEVGEGFERYGAVVMATQDDMPAPGLRVALLDAGGRDPYLPALRLDEDGAPFPAEVTLRLARDARFAALLADPGDPVAGERLKDGTWYPQDASRSAPELVTEVAKEYGLGEDAAALYLMLLAMPDPTDRNTARWTGWKPARLKAARAELAATDLVVEASRTRAGRSLFLPGGWETLPSPRLPLEQWKLPLHGVLAEAGIRILVPTEPAPDLYRRAWQRIREGDVPRFEELKAKRGRRR